MHPYKTIVATACAYAAMALVLIAPATLLYVSSAGSTLLYAMLLLAALHTLCTHRPGTPHPASLPRHYWRSLAWAAVLLLVSMGVAQVAHGTWHASGMEKALRFACVVPMALFFCRLDRAALRHVQWGIMAGALAGAHALIFPDAVFAAIDGVARPDTASFTQYNTVGFANLVMLFTTITVACLGWTLTPYRKTEQAVKIMVAAIGCYGVVLSQTRTSLVAIPILLLIVLFSYSHLSRRAKWIIAVAGVVLVALLSQTHIVEERVALARQEAYQCLDSPNTDSSICIRMQLLRAAGTMWSEHPVFGVGDGKSFRTHMSELADRGIVSRYVADNWGETHNDIAFMAATYGLIGALAFILLAYFVPAYYQWRRVRSADPIIRTAAVIGLLFVFEFVAFGMAEMMFRSMRTVSFYVVFTGVFLALSAPRRLPTDPS